MSIDWTNFTPLTSLAGGLLIGLAIVILFLWNGKIAGISGIIGGALKFQRGDILWRALFILGLLVSPLFYQWFSPLPSIQIEANSPTWIVAGFLVGLGTQLGSGCTSGHGVCGLSRLSLRSLVTTISFLVAGFITVFIIRHWLVS